MRVEIKLPCSPEGSGSSCRYWDSKGMSVSLGQRGNHLGARDIISISYKTYFDLSAGPEYCKQFTELKSDEEMFEFCWNLIVTNLQLEHFEHLIEIVERAAFFEGRREIQSSLKKLIGV